MSDPGRRRARDRGRPAARALSRPAAVQPRRMGDLLRPRADDRRGDPPPGGAAPGRGPRRLGLRQVLARPRGRPALAGARPCRQRRALADGHRPARAGGPLRNLAAELAEALGPPPGAAGDPAAAWHDRLALGAVALADIQAALEGVTALALPAHRPVRGAVPLGEGQPRGGAARHRAPAPHRRAVPCPRLFVILTMRSDYLGACAGFEGFAETVNQLPVPPAAHGRFRAPARDPRARPALWRRGGEPRSATGCCSRPGASRTRCRCCSTR